MNDTATWQIPVPKLDFNVERGGWLALIQARMGSSRLPGKVLLPIGGRPAIYHTWARTAAVYAKTVVCIPASADNDPLAMELEMMGAECFRWDGPENDVLSRFAQCYEQTCDWDEEKRWVVARVTADCPFLPAGLLRDVGVRASVNYYTSTFHPERTWPKGYDVEAFVAGCLGHAYRCAVHPYDREHVTPWIQRAMRGRGECVCSPVDHSAYRWTLDTPEDYAFFQAVAARIDCEPPHPTTEELLALLEREPELAKINT